MIHGALRDGRRRAANAPSTRFAFICSRPTAWPCRAFATSSSLAQGPTPITSASLRNANRPKADKKRLAPKPGSKPLTAQQRLERCLPPHLRNNADGIAQDETPFDPDPLETAKLALESFTGGKGFLTYLAIDQGRWRAAVWLVKLLIEHFHSPPARSSRSSQLIQEWTRTESLDDITEHPVYLNPFQDDHVVPHIKTSTSATLHELTDGSPDTFSGMEMLRHRILGLLWRDIGRLIIVCSSDTTIAGGQVKPDVLEMIALLHHYELMPDSIYTYNPPQSEDAIYQPPTLPLLSHRIFEALSDAAWRAREMSALEEAKKKIGGPVTLEARGSSIRARIPGVKPEVWLELILWSCLHGGWISDGASLLNSLYRSRAQEKWTTISWRDSLNAVVPPGQHETSNWDSVSSMFDARSSPKMHGVDVTGLRVHKTVSSEVVNAYIDALMTTVKLGVGDRGTDLDIVLRQLRSLRKLLQRTNLNLGGGSWDAMILRLVESGAISLDEDPAIVQHLATLSPTIGEELQSRRSQAVPSYVLDGSAAMLGLLHRALRTEIKNGNLEGALKVFRILQERVDNDMHQSMSDFFANKHLSSESEEIEDPSKGMFTSNFSGIDYPSFSMQIPPSILAAFLDLVTDTKSYSLGNWMLGIDNRDIDGPLIPLSLYSDPLISAAIVHFAATTENTALLSKITEEGAVKPQSGDSHDAPLPKELLQAFLDVQVNVRHWDSAEKLLEYMRDTEGLEWNPRNAATMAKVLIIESQASSAGKPGSDFHRAEILFTSLLMGRYGDWKIPPDPFVDVGTAIQRDHIESICVMASFVSPKLAATMHRLELLPKKFDFRLRSRPFMSILEAVVTTQNSEAGRALVDKFALYHEQPKEYRSRRSQPASLPEDEEAGEYRDALSEFDAPATTRPRMPRTLEAATEADIPSRRTIAIEIAGDKLNYKRNTIMYGGFSIRGHGVALTVVRKALAERAEQRANALSNARSDEQQQLQKSLIPSLDIFAWALITLRRAGVDRSALIKELENPENGLTDDEMQAVEQLAMDQWQAITDEWMARERDEPLPINRGYFLG